MVELQVNFIYGLGDLIASTTWAVNLCQEFRERGWESEVVITTLGNAYFHPDHMSVFEIIDKNSIPVPIREVNSRHHSLPQGKAYVYTTESEDRIGAHWLDIFCEPKLQKTLQYYIERQRRSIAYSCANQSHYPLPRIKIDVIKPSTIDIYQDKNYVGTHIRVEDNHTPAEVNHFKGQIDKFFQDLELQGKLCLLCSNSTYLKNYVKDKYSIITYTGISEEQIGYNFRLPANRKVLSEIDPKLQRANVIDTMTEMILLSRSKELYTLGYYGEGRISNFLYLSLLKGLSINQIILQ